MSLTLAVKVVHVVAGALWVGAAGLMAFYILPSIRALGPAGGPVMKELVGVRRLPIAIHTVSGLSLLTGLALFAFRPPNLSSPYGIAMVLGGACGLIASVLGVVVQSRNAKKLAALVSQIQGAPTQEQAAQMRQYQDRLYLGARVGITLLLLATLGMAMAHPL